MYDLVSNSLYRYMYKSEEQIFFFSLLCFYIPGRGIYILYEDVKSCHYEDVHVLWSILVESHAPALPPVV